MRWSTRGRVLAGAGTVVVIDQATKVWAEAALGNGERIGLLGDFLGLRLVYNAGAALSIGSGYTIILTTIAVVVTGLIVRYAQRLTSRWWQVVAALALGGAVGNLIDRLFRPPGFAVGHVVDFIDYNGWFVGNVADIAIVGAALAVVGLSLRGIDPVPASSEQAPEDDIDDEVPSEVEQTPDIADKISGGDEQTPGKNGSAARSEGGSG